MRRAKRVQERHLRSGKRFVEPPHAAHAPQEARVECASVAHHARLQRAACRLRVRKHHVAGRQLAVDVQTHLAATHDHPRVAVLQHHVRPDPGLERAQHGLLAQRAVHEALALPMIEELEHAAPVGQAQLEHGARAGQMRAALVGLDPGAKAEAGARQRHALGRQHKGPAQPVKVKVLPRTLGGRECNVVQGGQQLAPPLRVAAEERQQQP